MLRINDVIIDNRTVGAKFWLTEVVPVYQYVDGKKSDAISGYKYIVALPERNLEKIGVKIEGAQIVSAPESGFTEVTFQGLELYFFWMDNQPQVGARATGVAIANCKG